MKTNHASSKEKLLTFLHLTSSELTTLIVIALTMAFLFAYTIWQTEKLHERQEELSNSISVIANAEIETTETEDIATATA